MCLVLVNLVSTVLNANFKNSQLVLSLCLINLNTSDLPCLPNYLYWIQLYDSGAYPTLYFDEGQTQLLLLLYTPKYNFILNIIILNLE